MQPNSRICGDLTTVAAAPSGPPPGPLIPRAFAEAFAAAFEGPRSDASVSREIGWAHETVWRYRQGADCESSPPFDKVLAAVRRGAVPAGLQLMLLHMLADGCYLIEPVPEIDGVAQDDGPPDQAARLRAMVREAQRESVLLGERVDQALEDRRIDAQDLASVNEPVHRIRRLMDVIGAAAGGMFRRGRGVR